MGPFPPLSSVSHAINPFVSLDLILQRGNSPSGHGQFFPQPVNLSPNADLQVHSHFLPLFCMPTP